MVAYLDIVRSLGRQFTSLAITQKPRHDVHYADTLAYLAAAVSVDHPRSIAIELQKHLSINLELAKFKEMYISVAIF